MAVLQNALIDNGVTYLVYLRQARNTPRIDTVFTLAQAVAQNSPAFGAVLVDTTGLDAQESALVGPTDAVDAVVLSRGAGLTRRRLAGFRLDDIDEPLDMIGAWGLDQ